VAEYLASIGLGSGGGGEEWRGLLEAAFSARFAGLEQAEALPPAVLLPHDQPPPALQQGATQGAYAGSGVGLSS
jgi:hypothetical protein